MYDKISLTSGMRANLWSLQKTSNLLELTQSRLSSGKRVQSALDDPVKFFANLFNGKDAAWTVHAFHVDDGFYCRFH